MGKVKITNARFEELMREARIERSLRIVDRNSEVPAHVDEAADRAFRQMEAWIAAGVILSPAPEILPLPKAAGASGAAAGLTALKIAAVTVGAAALIGLGSYAAVPALREAVNDSLGAAQTQSLREVQREAKAPADYVIPSPGEDYSLKEELSTGTVAAKWFVAERRLLMVQIAPSLQETPPADSETVTVGAMVGALWEQEGDRLLLLHDGQVTVLIRMFNAERQEILDYAEAFAEANSGLSE